MKRLRFHIEKALTRNRWAFFLIHEGANDFTSSVGDPVIMRAVTEVSDLRNDATFYLRDDEVQSLMDQFWTLGFRPSEGTGSAGALKQAENHIESLKKIAFALVERVD